MGSSFVFSLAGDDSEFLYCFQVLYCSPCVGVPELLRVVIGRQCSRFPVDVTYKNEPCGLYACSPVIPLRGFGQHGCLVESCDFVDFWLFPGDGCWLTGDFLG